MNEQNHEANRNGALDADAVAATLNEAAAASGAPYGADSGMPEGATSHSAESAPPAANEPSAEAALDAIVTQLQHELAAEKTRFDELNDRFQRSSAEFQNTLRRRERQTNETIERASQHVVLKLLPVLDDLDRAFQNVPADFAADQSQWLDGFRQIQKKLTQVLEEEGVSSIPLEGVFDPTLHEAISSEPHDSVPGGHIIATLRVGYAQRGKVLRPALVRVAA